MSFGKENVTNDTGQRGQLRRTDVLHLLALMNKENSLDYLM